MENKVNFQDLLSRCSEFLNGIISQEELAEAVKDVRVRYYIPINEKIEIIQDILYETYFTMEPIEYKIRGLEIAKTLKGFLAYFTNLEYTEQDREAINHCDNYTYEVVQQVLYTGSPELVKLFEKDYEKFCNMIDTIVVQGDINNLINLFQGLDTETLKEENKKLRRSIKDVTKSKEGQKAISDLLEIARFNDPTMKRIIENDAVSSVKNNK